MKLKIMTYNVASGRCYENCDGTKGEKAYNDITECAKIIKGENPVFCGINEINVYDDGRENASQPEHQNAVLTLAKAIDETEGPIVLMGDFNIRPSDLLHKILRERLNDTADILGGTYLKTFPSYKHETYPDCKIDYIYVSDHFKTLSLKTLPTKASDHLPLIAEVEI